MSKSEAESTKKPDAQEPAEEDKEKVPKDAERESQKTGAKVEKQSKENAGAAASTQKSEEDKPKVEESKEDPATSEEAKVTADAGSEEPEREAVSAKESEEKPKPKKPEAARLPEIRPGDTLRVHLKVVEGNRERNQIFQGVVLKRQGSGMQETFTVRKISFGVGVERTFPIHSPKISKIEVLRRGHVRRAKLYYLREKVGKQARIREKR